MPTSPSNTLNVPAIRIMIPANNFQPVAVVIHWVEPPRSVKPDRVGLGHGVPEQTKCPKRKRQTPARCQSLPMSQSTRDGLIREPSTRTGRFGSGDTPRTGAPIGMSSSYL